MRGVWLGGLVVLLLSGTAQAQSTPLEPVSLAPPAAEPGWTVRALNGGYARWQTDADEATQGGVQVVPAPAVERAAAPPEAEARGADRHPPVTPRQPVCDALKRKLAIRLLELRGIDATDESAPYLLAALETPLSPHAWAGVRGLGPGAGSTLLATAYSSDLVARDLVDELARCLAQSGAAPRSVAR